MLPWNLMTTSISFDYAQSLSRVAVQNHRWRLEQTHASSHLSQEQHEEVTEDLSTNKEFGN